MRKHYFLLLSILCALNLSAQIQNHWVWEKGELTDPLAAGLMGIDDESNWPAARLAYESFTDSSGKLWFFGASSYFANHELWVFDPVTGNFTCKKTYLWYGAYNKGTGIEHMANNPGGSTQAWMDNDDNIWLFSITAEGSDDYNNSMWKYSNATGNWVEVRASTELAAGNFGTMGVPSPDNVPSGISNASTWTDGNGDLWMYGGVEVGWVGQGFYNFYNMLWKFDIETEQWTWVWGGQEFDQMGSYTQMGVESADNYPRSRNRAKGWTDEAGNIWIYGGRAPGSVNGSGQANSIVYPNDLWKFNPTTGLWTWVKGNAQGTGNIETYGTEDPLNCPTGLDLNQPISWNSGNEFWLYTAPDLLWKFNAATQNWTFVKGNWDMLDVPVVYGDKGVPNPDNTPGNLSINGGCGFVGPEGDLYFVSGIADFNFNRLDTWKYDISENAWVWVEGCEPGQSCPQHAEFESVMHPDVNPGGGRSEHPEWIDSDGNLWLFTHDFTEDGVDDGHMWKYDTGAKQWQWKDGRFSSRPLGIPELGIESPDINALSRGGAATWTDTDGNLWLFGGAVNNFYGKNDVWKFNTVTNDWTLVNGLPDTNLEGVYGTQGVAASDNRPGARMWSVTWTDDDGNFWLFGGLDGPSFMNGNRNDLWKYNPVTNQWAWMKGSQELNPVEVDNGIGVVNAANTPAYYSARTYGWKDNDGNLWLVTEKDIWKYDIAGNVWIKMLDGGDLNYGVLGVADAANFPGSRVRSQTWTDTNGDLILYSGQPEGDGMLYSDYWRYSVASGLWTWIGGGNEVNVPANYGTMGEMNYYNNPGGRYGAITWTDNNGNRMLYGGITPDFEEYQDVWSSNRAFNTVTGTVRFDSNNNGCQSNDIPASNIKVNFTGGSNPGFVFTDEEGNYTFITGSGEITITAETDLFAISPASQTLDFDGYQNTETLDFCLTAPVPQNNLEITIIPVDQAKPGFDTSYKIVYANKGTTTLSGTVEFTYDDAILDYVSADVAPDQQSAGSLEWDYANLEPFQSAEVNILLNINGPMESPPVNGGDFLSYSASIAPSGSDISPADNVFELNQEVVNAFDPNDKTCLQGDTITNTMVGDYVTYLVRFENTGTASAINIIVKDVIDTSKFDIESIEPVAASHDFRLEVTDGNVATFFFEGIQLPFGEDNPLRHGFVSFKIKTLSTLIEGDAFENDADIYFDYNYPIITNETHTEVVVPGPCDTPAPEAPASQTLCSGATINDLEAEGNNLWYSVIEGGEPLPQNTSLVAGSSYFASQVADECESIERTEVVVILTLVEEPLVEESTQVFCGMATVGNLEAEATEAGGDVVWYDAAEGGNLLNASYVLENDEIYYSAQVANGCESQERISVTANIIVIDEPEVEETAQSFCGSAAIEDLEAEPTVTGGEIVWYDAATDGNLLGAEHPLENEEVYYVAQIVNGCESVERVGVTALIIIAGTPDVENAAQSFCNAGTIEDLEAEATVTGGEIIWYDTAIDGNQLDSDFELEDAGVYYAAQVVGDCESTVRVAVTAHITIVDEPIATSPQVFEGEPGFTVINLYEEAEVEAEGTVKWYYTFEDAQNGENSIDVNDMVTDGTYYVTQTINGCESEPKEVIIEMVLGTTHFDGVAISYYPNPVKDDLIISGVAFEKADIIDTAGRLIRSQNLTGNSVDMQGLSTGIYIIKLTQGGKTHNIKVSKE